MHKDDWPSFADELSRKMLDQADLALKRFAEKEIDVFELKRTLGAIYDTASGLANRADLDVVATYYDKVEKAIVRKFQ